MPSRLPLTAYRAFNVYCDLVSAIVLLLPGETLAGSPGYRVVKEVFGRDWTIGLLLLLAGAVRLLLMLRPFTVYRRDMVAGFAAGLGALVWGIVAVGIFIALPKSLGSYIYLGIAGLHGWSYLALVADRILTAAPHAETVGDQ